MEKKQKPLRDKSIPSRRERRLEEQNDTEAIRYALRANSATEATREEDNG